MAGYVRADVRREQLLDAARIVLIRDGLEGLTLRQVAAQAGVNLSTLQYIFPSRAELVTALARRVHTAAGYDSFLTGPGGLEHELRRVIEWYATRIMADAGLVELVRYEFVSTVGPASSHGQVDHPLGRPLIGGYIHDRFLEITAQANEEYVLPVESLARLWTQGMTGLVFELLRDRDLVQFRCDAKFLADALVTIAEPRPRH